MEEEVSRQAGLPFYPAPRLLDLRGKAPKTVFPETPRELAGCPCLRTIAEALGIGRTTGPSFGQRMPKQRLRGMERISDLVFANCLRHMGILAEGKFSETYVFRLPINLGRKRKNKLPPLKSYKSFGDAESIETFWRGCPEAGNVWDVSARIPSLVRNKLRFRNLFLTDRPACLGYEVVRPTNFLILAARSMAALALSLFVLLSRALTRRSRFPLSFGLV